MKKKRKSKNQEEGIRFIKRLGELLQKGYHMENALSFLQVYSSDHFKSQIELIRVQLRDGATLCASWIVYTCQMRFGRMFIFMKSKESWQKD